MPPSAHTLPRILCCFASNLSKTALGEAPLPQGVLVLIVDGGISHANVGPMDALTNNRRCWRVEHLAGHHVSVPNLLACLHVLHHLDALREHDPIAEVGLSVSLLFASVLLSFQESLLLPLLFPCYSDRATWSNGYLKHLVGMAAFLSKYVHTSTARAM